MNKSEEDGKIYVSNKKEGQNILWVIARKKNLVMSNSNEQEYSILVIAMKRNIVG